MTDDDDIFISIPENRIIIIKPGLAAKRVKHHLESLQLQNLLLLSIWPRKIKINPNMFLY